MMMCPVCLSGCLQQHSSVAVMAHHARCHYQLLTAMLILCDKDKHLARDIRMEVIGMPLALQLLPVQQYSTQPTWHSCAGNISPSNSHMTQCGNKGSS